MKVINPLDQITKSSLVELKASAKPLAEIVKVFQALMIILGWKASTWVQIQKEMQDFNDFINSLKSFDRKLTAQEFRNV